MTKTLFFLNEYYYDNKLNRSIRAQNVDDHREYTIYHWMANAQSGNGELGGFCWYCDTWFRCWPL